MQKREANFTLRFRAWLKANPMPSSAFELKQSVTNSLPFGAVQEHQRDALLACKTKGGLLYKAPDDSRGIKPFDLFLLSNSYAWVVIRYPHSFHLIDIDTFLLEEKRSTRKSLTEDRAQAISTVSVKI